MKDTDHNLRVLLNSKLPEAPRSPWFTKKVLNRLPPRAAKSYAWIEYIAMALAAIIYISSWSSLIRTMGSSHAVTIGDITTATTLVVIGLAMAAALLIPYIKSWIRGY